MPLTEAERADIEERLRKVAKKIDANPARRVMTYRDVKRAINIFLKDGEQKKGKEYESKRYEDGFDET